MNWLMPGKSVEMPVLEGPGVITHMWFTSHAGWVGELNALSLRIYWDGSKEPGVEVPLGDFFAVGQGKPAVVESIPVQVSPTGSLTCYWRMPFRQSARIVVTNDNPDRSTGLYWQVDWVQLDELPPTRRTSTRDTARNIRPRRVAITCSPISGQRLLRGHGHVRDAGPGRLVRRGRRLLLHRRRGGPQPAGHRQRGLLQRCLGFPPAHRALVRPAALAGRPRRRQRRVLPLAHARPGAFHQVAEGRDRAQAATGDESEDGFFLERPDFLSSVAFWYQAGWPESDFPPLPPWHQRRVPWQHQHLVKAYRHAQTSGPAKLAIQTQGFFGARPVLAWPGQPTGATLTVPFAVEEDGRYAVRLTAAQGPGQGVFDVLLDGNRVLTADFRELRMPSRTWRWARTN